MVTEKSALGLRRLYHQRVTHSTFGTLSDVVRWLGAMQGQDYLGTKWAFAARLPGTTEAAVNEALDQGQVLRTWALRGTLHYVDPADIHWLVGLVAPRLIALYAGRYRELELDEATLARSTPLIADAVQGAGELTRSALFAILQAHGIATAGQRGVYMLQRAALERLIGQGPMRGAETTFRALPPGRVLPKEEALSELAQRYFTSHGPATLADFAQWAGLTLTEARAGLDSVRSALAEEQIDGVGWFSAPEAALPPDEPLVLLPGFDEFVLGYRDRSGVLDPEFADAVCPGGNGIFMATIVSDGRIIGTWKRTLKKKTVEIALSPFRPLRPDEADALGAAAKRYGAFLGLTPAIL